MELSLKFKKTNSSNNDHNFTTKGYIPPKAPKIIPPRRLPADRGLQPSAPPAAIVYPVERYNRNFNNYGRNELPSGWEAKRHSDGRVFFINHFEKRTTWDDPRPLPHGWRKGETNGRVFYISDTTHKTQWEDPRAPIRL